MAARQCPHPAIGPAIIGSPTVDGSPAAFRSFSITTPDGQTRTGTLDADGLVRFDDITPGSCQVSFPDLDGREWSPS